MSKDIRSYFTVISKKTGTSSTNNASVLPKKKVKRLIDSDDEDIVVATPNQKLQIQKHNAKKVIDTISSDSEGVTSEAKESIKSKTTEKALKLKPANVTDVFKNTPIKQSKVNITPQSTPATGKDPENAKNKKKKKTRNRTELGIHSDDKFEKTLSQLDDDLFEKHVDALDKVATEALLCLDNGGDSTTTERKRLYTDSPINTPKKKKIENANHEHSSKKRKIEHTDSGIDPGQEAYEKKRHSIQLYQRYLNRGTPKHQGMKELPKGKPNCLHQLCFLKTGLLDSLDSDDFENLIKQHGGRVVQSVSKKVNYVVVGDDPGPAKLAKAESLNIPNITEDELLDLILVKSGLNAKYCTNNVSAVSDDLGIEVDEEVKSIVEDEKLKGKEIKKRFKVDPEMNGKNIKASISSNSFYSTSSTSKIDETEAMSHFADKSNCEVDNSMLALTDKYKPQSLKAVIGQQGALSNLYKLNHWLQNWYTNQNPNVKKSLVRPSPWAKKDDGAYFKCALLSGPPGVGKTTSATLVCKELGLDIVEFNASDTRSKKLLHQEVSQLLSSNTIAGFATGQSHVNKRRVLLMDEVDGMAGNEDRGGIQELILLIKHSSIPIICMCNDRNHQKIRSLVNYCYDLKFTKPKLEQIRGAMMSVCYKEKIDISAQALTEIITGTECDVRQTLNHLSLLAASGQKISTDEAQKEAKRSKKDTVMGPWEVCRTVFTKSEHKDMSFGDKAKLFFFDYSLGPLFVQENYLKVQPEGNKKQVLLRAAFAADGISHGDLIDSKIRKTNNWSLLETEAIFSSVLPGHYMSGNFVSQINFPTWLGKNSKKNKFSRLISEIQIHARTSTYGSRLAIKLDYLIPLRNAIVMPLKKDADGVDRAVRVMKTYNLLREDVDSLVELCQWTRGENPMSSVDSKVKSAFTRTYNKQVTLLPYAPCSAVSKKKTAKTENELLGNEEETIESDNEDEDDDLSNNAMIKVKKAAGGKRKKEKADTNKKQENKKGKGKKEK